MPRWSRVAFVLVCCAPWVLGQPGDVPRYPKIEWFIGYSAIETNDHTFQFADIGPVDHLDYDEKSKGFEASVIGNLNRYFGIVGDFGAHFSSNQFAIPIATASQEGTINPRLFYFLAGPEVKWRNHSRVAPFAHALFGMAHSTTTFQTSGSVVSLSRTDAESGFAMAFSGGLDFRITRRVSFRGFLTRSEAYVGSNALPRQRVDTVGWSGGILFH
jgi:hypothetical protein